MKIRTDFVTNSSSYSSAKIVIDNPVLLEILQKYKDMGTFGEDEDDLNFSVGKFKSDSPNKLTLFNQFTKTPAIHYFNESFNHAWCPETLDEVLFSLIETLRCEYIPGGNDNDLFGLMLKELNNEKINEGFINIYWSTNERSNEHDEDYVGYISENKTYEYKNNIGEDYSYEKDGNEMPDDEPYESVTNYKFNGVDVVRFYEILGAEDFEQEEKLRIERGYGLRGSENDDHWEFAKRVGYIRHFHNFPKVDYNRFKESGEIKFCEEWISLFGEKEVKDGGDKDQEAE